MRDVCSRHNVQWHGFITNFSSAWFNSKAIEMKLLQLADREFGGNHSELIKAQGCLFKELRQAAFIRALRLGGSIDFVTSGERDLISNLAPPSNWGRPLPAEQCEELHQLAVHFDANRCLQLKTLNVSNFKLSVEVWDQGGVRPKHVMNFRCKVSTLAISELTCNRRSKREDALSVPLLGHLVVASKAVRSQCLPDTPFGGGSPFHRYLISAGQGVINRIRCRYTATKPSGEVAWQIDDLDRISQGLAVAAPLSSY
jgi:hypothetical protein